MDAGASRSLGASVRRFDSRTRPNFPTAFFSNLRARRPYRRGDDLGVTGVNDRLKLRENQRFEIAMTVWPARSFESLDARRRPDSAVDLSVADEGRVIVPCQDRSRRRRGPKASLYKGLSPGHAPSPRATIECARAGTRRGAEK